MAVLARVPAAVWRAAAGVCCAQSPGQAAHRCGGGCLPAALPHLCHLLMCARPPGGQGMVVGPATWVCGQYAQDQPVLPTLACTSG